MKLRKLALSLHRYIGLMVGLLLILISLTGSVLVFSNEIDQFLNPALLQVVPQEKRVSVQSVLDTVRSTYPKLKLESIDIPQNPTSVYRAWTQSPDKEVVFIYINPYTGKILGSRLQKQTLHHFVVELHINLLAGELGTVVVGVCGALTVLLCITGLILWPGWKRAIAGFKIRWQAPWKLIGYDLHKVVGIVSVTFLLLIASTGAAMSFFSEFERAMYSLTFTPIPPIPTQSQPAAGRKTLIADRVLFAGRKALPGTQTIWLDLPSDAKGLFRVGKRFSEDTSLSSASSDSQIYVDQYNGKVVQVNTVHKAPIARRIVYSLYPLHIGSYGGLGMRIIYVLVGLAPAGLFVTGWVLWRQRQWAIARRQEATQRSQLQPTHPQ